MFERTEGIYNYHVYILTNIKKTVLYVGVTNNLKRRLIEHKSNVNSNSFTSRYKVYYLVYYEKFTWIQLAIEREKEIKEWSREKKDELIKQFNPNTLFLNTYFED